MAEYLCLYRASPDGQSPEPVDILISNAMPQCVLPGEATAIMRRDAERLERALYKALPCGTYDLLLAQMAARVASQLTISHASGETPRAARAAGEMATLVQRVAAGMTTAADAQAVEALVAELQQLREVARI